MLLGKSLIAFVFVLLFIGFAAAQESVESIKGQVGDVEKYKEIISDENARLAFLNESWGKLLNNTSLGAVLVKVEETGSSLSPFFELVLGLKFILSWHFFLTFLLWVLFLNIAFSGLAIFYAYMRSDKLSKLARWGIFLLFFLVISTIRIPRFISLFVISFISKTGHWAFQLILIALVFVIIVFFFIYAGMLRRQFSKLELVKDVKISKEKVKEQERGNRAFKEGMISKSGKVKSIEEDAEEQAREDIEGMSEGN